MKNHDYIINSNDDDDPNLIIDLGVDEDKSEALKCNDVDGDDTHKS